VTLTGLVSGSEVRAYLGTPDSSTLIAATESSGTSYAFGQSYATQVGFIVVRKATYKFLRIDVTYSADGQSIPVQQQFDRDYLNP
jgi:adenine/guanine phosphoribosyltransferase-like PRPP-binding protein